MIHLLRKIGDLINTLEYAPRMFFLNPARNFFHSWFPHSVAPVCRDGDFICSNSNGLIKLADVLPSYVMDGFDVVADHPYRVVGLVATGACLLGAFHLYRNRARQQNAASDAQALLPVWSRGLAAPPPATALPLPLFDDQNHRHERRLLNTAFTRRSKKKSD